MPTRLSAQAEAERRAILAQCVEEGWPVTEIIDTHGIAQSTIQKYHPGYSGMSQKDKSEIIGLRHKLRTLLKKRGLLREGERL